MKQYKNVQPAVGELKPPSLPDDGWALLTSHMTFYQRVMEEAELGLRPLRLDVKSFFLLAAVDACPHPAALARHLMMPKPTVTFLIKRLEALDYLLRDDVPGDLRRFRLSLTAKGRDAMQEGKQIVTRTMEKSITVLSPTERRTYAALVGKLQSAVPE